MDEADRIRERYERRRVNAVAGRYSFLNPIVMDRVQERQRALIGLLAEAGHTSLAGLRIAEVGCGAGNNLLELIMFGADPRLMCGNDLLSDRIDLARARLPACVDLRVGDAARMDYPDAEFDLVLQSTVFTSILDQDAQQQLAEAMWRWLKPGGGVVWYDFVYDNPANPDVRGVPLRRIEALFPGSVMKSRRVTLAPPLARRVPRLAGWVLGAIPPLRSHRLCWIGKPR